ncbi:hypothetical protein Bca52824_070738 [Brassica carinata]|uniref:non-specific serine/threonine protein kinase n=1 Tax=Brassica carinata TaxID=52824 RepID=A0A8X7Q4H7_BRACI|nr:hypothetical protein Bca52824_070738 [Brassica carinata]
MCFGNRLVTVITLGNFLFGSIPDSLGKCESLTRIRMGQNFLNGSIPNGLFGLPELSQVELQDNYLTGELPLPISGGVSVNLGQISLSNNQLSGPLPPAIGNFSGVQKLLLDGNKFSGPIPSEIGRLQQLSKLDFSHNLFSGGIAPEISRCKLLTYVDLSRNELSGEIPNEITSMRILNYLNVSRNHLVAAIVKARSLRNAAESKAWRLTAFQRLDFTCDDLLVCLKEDNIIGKGGAGIVYKGVMPSGDLVAVKRLATMSHGSSHDHGFNAEIQTLGRIRHRHIVRLLGFALTMKRISSCTSTCPTVALRGPSRKERRLSSVPVHEVTHVFYVALLCVEEQAVARPTMREVVQILTELPKIPLSKQLAVESDVTEKSPAVDEDLLSN